MLVVFVFFFKQKTAYEMRISDWSSDVCSSDLLKITSSNTEQEEAQEEVEIDYSHEPLDVGFNVHYLLDVLGNVKSETVQWSVQPDVNASILITLPGDDQFKYVVMPMRI